MPRLRGCWPGLDIGPGFAPGAVCGANMGAHVGKYGGQYGGRVGQLITRANPTTPGRVDRGFSDRLRVNMGRMLAGVCRLVGLIGPGWIDWAGRGRGWPFGPGWGWRVGAIGPGSC